MKTTYIKWDNKEQRLVDALMAIVQLGCLSPSTNAQYAGEIARRALVDIGHIADGPSMYEPLGLINEIKYT